MKLGAVAVGAVAAQALPGVGGRPIANVPITYGAILGAFLLMRGKGAMRWVGFGMVLGGGVLEIIEGFVGPALASAAPAAPAAGGDQ
tara:strand:- start:2538 stop:2798 length:261 start_codon:yes stop_codon:yes gene_type:complete